MKRQNLFKKKALIIYTMLRAKNDLQAKAIIKIRF